MIVIFYPGADQRDTNGPGHYFSCEDCGWCSSIFYGEGSRLRAVSAAHLHAQAKAHFRADREFVIPNVTEITDPLTPVLHWDSR